MEIWRIGSRWSAKGDSNYSILDIFLKYNVCFASPDLDFQKDYFKNIKEGDLIAISDGIKKIAAIGKTITYTHPLPNLNINFCEADKKNYIRRLGLDVTKPNIIGMKVNIINLEENKFSSKKGIIYPITEDKVKTAIQDLWAGKEVDITNLSINYGKS